jgi:exopolysaccharide biosynthesis polyprenyl glycosylphosphotransferase
MAIVLALLEGGALFAALWLMGLVAPWPAAAAVGWPGVLAVSAITALYYTDCYDLRRVSSVSRFAPRLLRCVALASVPLGAYSVVVPHAGTTAMATLLLLVGLPTAVRGLLYRAVRSAPFAERILIVGSGPLAQKVAEVIQTQSGHRYVTVGMIDGAPVHPASRWRRLRAIDSLDRFLDMARPDRIVVARGQRRTRLPVQPLLEARLRGIAVEDGAEFYERLTGKLAIEALTPSSLIFSKGFRHSLATLATARALSVVIAVGGLLILAPFLGVIALFIKLDSRGPVFFRQERVGLSGRRFTLVKFRTMHDAEDPRSEWACDNRHRITRVGRWLRAFRLDELPQFVNILKGDMDIVGPRPHPASNFSLFVTVLRNSPECGEQIPYYSLRSMVRPGITGWAQVRYRYANNLEEEIEKMRYDLYYVKHRSLWLDLRILAATLKIVVAGRGSAEVGGTTRDAGQGVGDAPAAHPGTMMIEPATPAHGGDARW